MAVASRLVTETQLYWGEVTRDMTGHGGVIARLFYGDSKEWATRHSQWKVLLHDDASSTGLSALFQLCHGL